MSKPAKIASAAPIQPEGLYIEIDGNGFQTCSVKNTAQPKKMKFTSIEYIKLVKTFVYNFELITKTVSLENLKKIDIFDYNSIISANTDIDNLLRLVNTSNDIIISNHKNCITNYNDDDEFLKEYENYIKKIYNDFKRILTNFYTTIRSTKTFGSECKNNIISLLGNDSLYQLRRSYQYMIESFGVIVNLYNNLIKNGDEKTGKITNINFDSDNNGALVRKMLIYSSLISKHKYYIFPQNICDIKDEVTEFFKINKLSDATIRSNLDYYLNPIRNINFLWRMFRNQTFTFSNKANHNYAGFFNKMRDLRDKMLEEFVIDDVENKKRQIFIEMNIEFSKAFSKIGGLIPNIKDVQKLPFMKLDTEGLKNMDTIIEGVKRAIQDLTSDNKFINKINDIDDMSLNVDLKLYTLDTTNSYNKFNKYIVGLRDVILLYLKNIVTLLHNIRKIQQDYDQSKHTEFYNFLSNIFYRCLNILILYDHFFKKYLDIFINEDKLIPEFDTTDKVPVMNIFGKLIVENTYISDSSYKQHIEKKTKDDIKTYADNINIIGDIYTILTLGYHLDDKYNETVNRFGDDRYEGIINVLNVFSYSERITYNLSNSFNLFNEKIGISNYYDFLYRYIQSAKPNDTDIEVDINGVNLFKTNEEVSLSFLIPKIPPWQPSQSVISQGTSSQTSQMPTDTSVFSDPFKMGYASSSGNLPPSVNSLFLSNPFSNPNITLGTPLGEVPMNQSDLLENERPMNPSDLLENERPMNQSDLLENEKPMNPSDLLENEKPMNPSDIPGQANTTQNSGNGTGIGVESTNGAAMFSSSPDQFPNSGAAMFSSSPDQFPNSGAAMFSSSPAQFPNSGAAMFSSSPAQFQNNGFGTGFGASQSNGLIMNPSQISSNTASNDGAAMPSYVQFNMSQNPQSQQPDVQNIGDFKTKVYDLKQNLELLSRKIDKYKNFDNSHSYYTRLHKISDYRTFKTQTDREPQDFIARIKLKNIGGKQNVGKYKYITEDSLGKVANNNRARELANNYNQLTDKMIETEKKIGGIQKLALNDLNKSESGYIRMRGGEQQTLYYNNLIKQYQLMAIKQNNIINEIKNIKNGNY